LIRWGVLGGLFDPFCYRAHGVISGRLIEDLSLNLGLDWLLSQHALDRRGGDAVSPGDLADALALAAIALDGGIVEY
jgi:hypothetical protein